MLHFNINLTSLAFILWSGMLIIAGSILVLSSQVRKVADLIEDQGRTTTATTTANRLVEPVYEARLAATPARIARRGASVSLRSTGRTSLGGTRAPGQQLGTLRREASLTSRIAGAETTDGHSIS